MHKPAGPQCAGIGAVSGEHSPEMLQLFHAVFGTALPADWWPWKYGPAHGRGFGYWEDGRLLAHCGIFPRRVHVAGQPCRAWQLGDLMVADSTRGRNLSRSRTPFAQVAQAALARVPDTDNPQALAFGFPSDRAMRIGAHLGFFATIDQWHEIEFAAPLPRRSMLRVGAVAWSELRWRTQIAALWQRMRGDLNAHLVGERGADYWIWRYADHPLHDYRLVAIRRPWQLRPCAFVVLRETAPGRWLWVDFVGPLAGFSVAAHGAGIACRQWGGQQLSAFGSTTVAHAARGMASAIRPTEIRIMANPASGSAFLERFAQRWWLMAGDTDYL